MQTTGIVRRVDDLGRIVIPKEIRKSLKIKNGECLEILLDNDKIMLKKQNIIGDSSPAVEDLIRIAAKTINADILITNNDKVIFSQGKNSDQYINKEINSKIYNLILGRKKTTENIDLLENEKKNYLLQPLITNGDAIGSIIFIKNDVLSEIDYILIEIVNKLLINHIEI